MKMFFTNTFVIAIAALIFCAIWINTPILKVLATSVYGLCVLFSISINKDKDDK